MSCNFLRIYPLHLKFQTYWENKIFHHVLFDISSICRDAPPPYLDIVYLCPLCFSWSMVSGQSGFHVHFLLWVLIFLSNLPWSFLMILSALCCFEEETFKILSSIFVLDGRAGLANQASVSGSSWLFKIPHFPTHPDAAHPSTSPISSASKTGLSSTN